MTHTVVIIVTVIYIPTILAYNLIFTDKLECTRRLKSPIYI